MRQGEATAYAKRLTKALNDLSMVFERAAATGRCIVIPESCSDLIEIHRLLTALRIKRMPSTSLTGQPFPVNPATPAPPTPVRRPFPAGPLTQREIGEMNTRRHPDLQHVGARPLRTEPLGGKGE